jgi:hypothetical protein
VPVTNADIEREIAARAPKTSSGRPLAVAAGATQATPRKRPHWVLTNTAYKRRGRARL